MALLAAGGMQTDALYLFHDLSAYFTDPVVLRSLRDIAQSFARARRAPGPLSRRPRPLCRMA